MLAPFVGLMPDATLAAVVIVYSVGLIEPEEFRDIARVRRTEFVWALAALAGVVLLGTLQGIVVAIIVSFVALVYQVSDPPVHVLVRKPGYQRVPAAFGVRIPMTRASQACFCCGRRAACSLPMPSESARKCSR